MDFDEFKAALREAISSVGEEDLFDRDEMMVLHDFKQTVNENDIKSKEEAN